MRLQLHPGEQRKIQELAGEQSEKVAQNLAAGVAGFVYLGHIGSVWIFRATAAGDHGAQSRQQYLAPWPNKRTAWHRVPASPIPRHQAVARRSGCPPRRLRATPGSCACHLRLAQTASASPSAAIPVSVPSAHRATGWARRAVPGDGLPPLLPAEHLRRCAMTERARLAPSSVPCWRSILPRSSSIFARKKAGAPAIAAKFPIRGHKAVMLYVDAA